MGKIADALALILACTTANDASVNYSRYVPGCRSRYLEIPHCPMGISHVLRLCLQGGGVFIGSGTVTFLSCTVTGNTARNVRAHAQTSHRPDGKIADALASTLAYTTAADAPVNYSLMYVHQRLTQNFPSPRWEDG